MSWNPEEDVTDSEDDEEVAETKGREAFIFVIDALLHQNSELFEECLGIIMNAFLNGLLTRGKDLIGLIFNNTNSSPPPKDTTGMENIVQHENTAVFIPLRPLSKETVDYYMNFREPDHFDFGNRYGSKEGSFSNLIWLCTNMFQQCGYKLSIPSIIYFTDRDTPHSPDTNDYQQALRKAKDLNEIRVDFTVIPMRDEFDYNVFYKEFFCTATDADLESFNPDDPKRIRELIANRMIRRNFQSHCTTHIRWRLSDKVQMAVGIYNCYQRNIYPKSVKILREDNSIIDAKRTCKISNLNPENGEYEDRNCLPSEQRKMIYIGGEKIYFSAEELHEMKCPLGPGIRLLGFKPRSTVNQHHFLKSADFVYPNESILAGSTRLFRALWEKCLSRDKIAFCVLVARRNSSPKYVALIPTRKQDSMAGDCSEGFHVWYLPSQTDIRKVDFEGRSSYDDTQDEVDLMTKLVKKLRIKYTSDMIKNPSLDLLRSNIIDVSFDINISDPVDLNSLECFGIDEERLNRVVDELQDRINSIQPDPEQETATKRKQAGQDGQRAKVARTTVALTKDDVDRLLSNQTLEKLTVKELREYLQSNNITGISSATKPVLLGKVRELHFE